MKTPPRLLLAIVATLGLLFGTAQPARATTINWGNYLSSTSYLFDSTGSNLDDTYYFELGSFGTFIPNAANMGDWLTNWKVFDRAQAPLSEGWDSSSGSLGHSAVLEVDFTTSNASLSQSVTFAAGEQAYIWVYQDTTGTPTPSPTLDPGFEWALVTNNSLDGEPADDWVFPSPSGHVVSTLDWRIEDANATPFGGLNNTQGPGDFTDTPGDYTLQTHTLVAPVPEPSGSLLILTAGMLGLLRRRRA